MNEQIKTKIILNNNLTINTLRISNNLMEIDLIGSIDTYNSIDFQKLIITQIEMGFDHLLFDCMDLDYISSSGIGAFTYILKKINNNKHQIVLISVKSRITEVFTLLGFINFFSFSANKNDAIKILNSNRTLSSENLTGFLPIIQICNICKQKMRIQKPGKYKCPKCKTGFSI